MKASLQWIRSLLLGFDKSDEFIVQVLDLAGWNLRAQPIPSARDTILIIDDTHRVDLLGHVGIARELATLFRLPFVPPGVDAPIRVSPGSIDSLVQAEVKDQDRCPHYGLLVIEDVKNGPSPSWLRVRLNALDVEPRNVVTDLSLLVLLESGHPVHVYDLDQIKGPLVVRRANQTEALSTADRSIPLDPDDLVVSDNQGPLSLAGILGSSRAEVTASTKRILIECACFDNNSILRSVHRHGLDTESSRRHQLGVNRTDTVDVLAQAGALATHLAKGAAISGSIHLIREPWQPVQALLREKSLSVPWSDAMDALSRQGCEVVPLHDEGGSSDLQITAPAFRPDLRTEADFAREARRVHDVWIHTRA